MTANKKNPNAQERDKLFEEIDVLRAELIEVASRESFSAEAVLSISRRIDRLILQYMNIPSDPPQNVGPFLSLKYEEMAYLLLPD